jgi:peptide/nickel transport system permease protein
MRLQSLARYPSIILGAGLILAMAVAALLAPILAPRDPAEVRPSIGEILLPPGPGHLLGTDDLGRDVLSRLLYGARISLSVGFLAVGISLLIGVILGAVAGYYGGWVDLLVMRLVEIVMMFPAFFFILMILAFLGPGIGNVMIVIGVFSWTGLCRLVRAEFLSLREREFVLAARGLGASGGRIIFRHILPNSLAPVFVYATLAVGGAILTEAGISFLGLGVQPPAPSWGNIITTGRHFIDSAWWLTLFPGLAILVTVLSYNLLGQGLQDAFDPRLARMKR